MRLNVPFVPKTIYAQINATAMLALLIILTGGPMLERWVRNDFDVLDLERISGSVLVTSKIFATATPAEREAMLAAAQRSGWDLTLQPLSVSARFTTSSANELFLDSFSDWLFPPDDWDVPLGGWRTFLNGKRIVAAQIDDTTMLVSGVSSKAILRSDFVGSWSYYLVALFTLILLLSAFAIWAIMMPLRRIAHTAMDADLSHNIEIFEERGSVEIVALAKALNSMRRRIATMMESRTRMLRGISHDLRTPLTRLKLRAEHMPAGAGRDAMLTDINHLDRLLNESLSYLRDNHGQERVERTDIASTLQTICNEFADVDSDVTYRGPNRLIADCKPLAITRAVTNLCDNAIKFGSSVTVELTEAGGMMTIDVMDDGPGIADEDKERVLEPFFKVDAARHGANTGFGLGLSIVAEVVQAHRGKLTLLDREPNGLIARIELPLR